MGSVVPIHRDCRESEGVPQIQISSLSLFEWVPEMPEGVYQRPVGVVAGVVEGIWNTKS